MQEDALEKVQQGVTTIEEMMRVLPVDGNTGAVRCRECGRESAAGVNFCPICGNSLTENRDGHKSLRGYTT